MLGTMFAPTFPACAIHPGACLPTCTTPPSASTRTRDLRRQAAIQDQPDQGVAIAGPASGPDRARKGLASLAELAPLLEEHPEAAGELRQPITGMGTTPPGEGRRRRTG